jgi:hypothetical protein
MNDFKRQTGKCKRCSAQLSEETLESHDELLCSSCRIALAEEQIAADMQKAAAPQKRKWLWPVLKFAFLAIALGVIAFQYPRLMTAFETPKPLRQGSYATDVGTDRCIHNLWLISRGLGEGQIVPEKGMVCPVSGQPYIVDAVDGNRIVSCPDPQRHGLSILRVSRKNPVPEVKP